MTVRLLTGDCRAMLATLPDASVQMACTSPPYFGLRDYGTASWQGGDAACDHLMPEPDRTHDLGRDRAASGGTFHGGPAGQKHRAYQHTCGKCGATRVDQQIGLEPTVEAYVAQMVAVFREVWRVLRDDGVLFLNLGDSYASGGTRTTGRNDGGRPERDGGFRNGRWTDGAWTEKTYDIPRTKVEDGSGLKPKDLIGIPWRVAFALQQPWLTCRGCGTENHFSQWANFPNGRRICPACELSKGHDISESGWYLRSDIIWAKPNPMPESVRDRPTKAHEYIFLLTKSPRYFWDAEAVKEDTVPLTKEHYDRYRGKYSGVKNAPERNDGDNAGNVMGNGHSRNIRSVWTIATSPFSAAHFATFPPALAERCIKAGTSEKGACGACWAPWVRVVERITVRELRVRGVEGEQPKHAARMAMGLRSAKTGFGGSNSHNESTPQSPQVTTIGWQPTCPCDAPIAPCVVLDCFGGAGTVSLVSERLGRDSIYIDLSESYAAMARKRIYDDAPMFAAVQE